MAWKAQDTNNGRMVCVKVINANQTISINELSSDVMSRPSGNFKHDKSSEINELSVSSFRYTFRRARNAFTPDKSFEAEHKIFLQNLQHPYLLKLIDIGRNSLIEKGKNNGIKYFITSELATKGDLL